MPLRYIILAVTIGLGVTLTALWGYPTLVGWVQGPLDWIVPDSVPAKTYTRVLEATGYALAALPGIVVAAFLSAWWSRRRVWETRCRECGYILRGITEPRCPECGQSI